MKSCIYEGWVHHRRFEPVAHAFRYRMFMMCLDLAELDDVFRGRWLWSVRRPALAWFRRRDHLGDPAHSLDSSVRALVERETGSAPRGPIRLVTHLRYFGYCTNPVSFYYCLSPDEQVVEAIVAEVHNTPWGERHCYVLNAESSEKSGSHRRFRFPKAFHVSPFMGMEQTYVWRFTDPERTMSVHMENHEDGRCVFDATLSMRRRPITGASLARVLVQYPLMTGKVVAAIYLQALKLRLKRCPFYAHPRRAAHSEVSST